MKLFQQLLVAPAALGLMAPVAATAAELNINGVSDYAASSEQVTNASQFSDVHPSDWAYQALTNLAEQTGCVAGTPSGNQSMTRFEAAALLNSCLGNVAEASDDVRRLTSEFGPELAVLKGRVDGLSARVGEFEAGQFSSTTKLDGYAIFTLGGISYNDRDDVTTPKDATTMNYTWQANLRSSFTGEDMLYTRLKTGNFGPSMFKSTSDGTYLNHANSNDDTLKVDKLWYSFPVGDNVKAWLGAKIENYYMLASAPSVYKPILKSLKLGGNGAVYGASTGQGFGAAWTQSVDDRSEPRFAVSANYTASSSTGEDADPTKGGILTDGAKGMFLTKVEYGSPRWQVSAAYSHKTADPAASAGFGTVAGRNRTGEQDAIGLRAYWKPEDTGAVPSISVGYDIANIDAKSTGDTEETTAWMIGLSWKDAFIDGNSAGLAFGANQYATEKKGGGDTNDENTVLEAWYTFQVSDNVSVTPAVFALTDPKGDGVKGDDVVGALINTKFKF
ncbi:iron uptake porin [Prochlorococcus sp. MIT 1300]|uniref:iron uptake porin n=1 Tax=Prochlorococcus sp. MIT 1300 TaxID=3096218 RepID=UPI002A750673|nr:iron uptake porin [Prochlorococcus sp. MIT 1300]